MSYPQDLDEYSNDALIEEINRRVQKSRDACCDYCGRKRGSFPPCRFPARHIGKDSLLEHRPIFSGDTSDFIDIVFDGPPSHEAPRFVETEDSKGRGILVGHWTEREDGRWVIRIYREEFQRPFVSEVQGDDTADAEFIEPQVGEFVDSMPKRREAFNLASEVVKALVENFPIPETVVTSTKAFNVYKQTQAEHVLDLNLRLADWLLEGCEEC